MNKADRLLDSIRLKLEEVPSDQPVYAMDSKGNNIELCRVKDIHNATRPGKDAIIGLEYRPYRFDDWGTIRDMNGRVFTTLKINMPEQVLDQHRNAGTDPFERFGKLFIECLERGL